MPGVERLVGSLGRLCEKLSPVLMPVLQLVGWSLEYVVGPALSLVFGIIGKGPDLISWLIDRLGNLLDLLGKVKDFGGNVLGGIGNAISHIPGFAEGSETPGGPVLVGERGPEVILPPAGSRVVPMCGAGSASGSGRMVVDNHICLDEREMTY